MDYFMFKRISESFEGKLSKGDERDYNFVFMRYCKKCGSRIWGVWSFRNKSYLDTYCGANRYSKDYFVDRVFLGGYEPMPKNIDDSKGWCYKAVVKYKKTPEYKKLLSYREELKEFLNTKFCPVCGDEISYIEVPYFFNSYNSLGVCLKVMKVNDEFRFSKESLNLENCKIGEMLITPQGIGECVDISGDGMCKIKFFDKLSFDSIHNYVINSFKEIYFKPNGKNKLEKFKKENRTEPNVSEIQINFSKEDLLKYLLQIIETEKCLYSLTTRLEELYALDLEYSKLAYASKKLYLNQSDNSPDKLLKKYKCMVETDPCAKITMDMFSFEKPNEPKCPKILKPNEPILSKPGLFNKKAVIERNDKLLREYNESLNVYNDIMDKYQIEIKDYKQRLAQLKKEQELRYESEVLRVKKKHDEQCAVLKHNYEVALAENKKLIESPENIVTTESVFSSEIKKEITIAEKLFINATKALNDLYSYDIIFCKYRNIVAVSSFYEYLISGRCETLAGVNGAYNLYENEIRIDTVISQLSRVIMLLENIRDNQYMLYTAISEMNRQLTSLKHNTSDMVNSLNAIKAKTSNIESSVSTIADNSEVIAYNTERTAFYAKRNAELTNALGYMIALS